MLSQGLINSWGMRVAKITICLQASWAHCCEQHHRTQRQHGMLSLEGVMAWKLPVAADTKTIVRVSSASALKHNHIFIFQKNIHLICLDALPPTPKKRTTKKSANQQWNVWAEEWLDFRRNLFPTGCSPRQFFCKRKDPLAFWPMLSRTAEMKAQDWQLPVLLRASC